MAYQAPTQGPWRKLQRKRSLLITDEHGNHIATIKPVKRYGITGTDAGNANLIIAAPDFDHAARALARHKDAGEPIPESAWQQLYDAIAKAAGH